MHFIETPVWNTTAINKSIYIGIKLGFVQIAAIAKTQEKNISPS